MHVHVHAHVVYMYTYMYTTVHTFTAQCCKASSVDHNDVSGVVAVVLALTRSHVAPAVDSSSCKTAAVFKQRSSDEHEADVTRLARVTPLRVRQRFCSRSIKPPSLGNAERAAVGDDVVGKRPDVTLVCGLTVADDLLP